MIHSMSGGVLSEYDSYTFVKVEFDGEPAPQWYISDFDVEAGDRVKAPFGRAGEVKTGVVARVERDVNGQVTPVPVKRAKRLISKV